ncbi:MAG: hypothetical protein OXU20_30745, partial [Myxococcales bacterium]|nr:hypothetical protein [Myxococcales bacterium]
MDARSRRHFDAIAKAFAQDGETRLVEALARSQLDRVREGFELGQTAVHAEADDDLDIRARAQAQLHTRAREQRASGR